MPQVDSRGWTGEIGTEYVPPARSLPRLNTAEVPSRASVLAVLNIVILIASPYAFMAALRLVEAATPGLLALSPPFPDYFWLPVPAGLALLALVRVSRAARPLIAALAFAGWVWIVAGAIGYFGAGVRDSRAAALSEPQRAYVGKMKFERHGRPTTLFQLQDGRRFVTRGFSTRYGDTTRCYSLRTRAGPSGFGWIELLDGSPRPGSGQLAWPVDPERCFSSVPLEQAGS